MKYIIFAILMAASTAAYVQTATNPATTYPAASIETASSEVGYSEPTYNVDVEDDDDDDDEEVKDQIDTSNNDVVYSVPVYETVAAAPAETNSAPIYYEHKVAPAAPAAPTAVYEQTKTVLPYWLRPKTDNY